MLDRSQIQVVVVVIPALATTHDNLFLFLVVRHGIQQFFELRLCHFLPQLARLRERNQPIFNIFRPLFLDEADAAQSVGRLGVQDLVENVLSGVVLLSRGGQYLAIEIMDSA